VNQFPAIVILAAKTAAACHVNKRLPAIKDITRPAGAKQANHIAAPGNPLSAPTTEILQTNLGHDPNPAARIVPMDMNGGMAGSRSGFQETHNFPNMLPGAST
jgi:hypothetical protein